MIYEASLPRAVMGCSVEFVTQTGERSLGEVVGIDGHRCKVMPYLDINGINSDTKVYLRDLTTTIKNLKGNVGSSCRFSGEAI
jgi:flagellum-specific ATP synthase